MVPNRLKHNYKAYLVSFYWVYFVLDVICQFTERIFATYIKTTEAVFRRCSPKKVFLEVLQISQESTCAFSEICKIFKNTFFTEHLWWLLLKLTHCSYHKDTLTDFNDLTDVLNFFVCTWINSCDGGVGF